MTELQSELLALKGKEEAISPHDVVAWAKKHKSSALYAAFDERGLWDDKTAADMARLDYGRAMIRRYRIKIVGNDRQTHKVRYWVSPSAARGGDPSYYVRTTVLSMPERRAQLMADCATDIRALIIERYCDVLTERQLGLLETVAREVDPELSEQEHVA